MDLQGEPRRFLPTAVLGGRAAAAGLDEGALAAVVRRALAEDVGSGDLTSEGLIPARARCRAVLVLEEPGVACGLGAAQAVFAALDPSVVVEPLVGEGARVEEAPALLARIDGNARAVLAGERTALNLLGRMCAIATVSARYVEQVAGSGVTILDTRKTTPGLRALERYAVRCGGATNHRAGLYDAILVKENHLRLSGGVGAALAALAARSGLPVEVEAETLAEVAEALEGGAARILLDNMTVAEVREAVGFVAGRAQLEASGGITLETVRAYAETGVDCISVGALTRSVRALDVSLEVE
jgi:nicotinate-nucleotide pyrophosphorylase (carboxylating)